MDINQIIADTGDLIDPANRLYALGSMQEATRLYLAGGATLEESLENADGLADPDCEHTGTLEQFSLLVQWAVRQGEAFTGWAEPTIRQAVADEFGADEYALRDANELVLNLEALTGERGLWSNRAA